MKTAVELLCERLEIVFKEKLNEEIQWFNNLKNGAIEAEKQQIIKACFDGAINYGELNYIPDIKFSSERYYKEKYQNK